MSLVHETPKRSVPSEAGPLGASGPSAPSHPGLRDGLDILVCPRTKSPLTFCSASEAESRIGAPLLPRKELPNAKGRMSQPFGRTETVLLRQDLKVAYPVVDGVPILLAPEMLAARENPQDLDLKDPKYAEAYEEMEFYNQVASEEAQRITSTPGYRMVSRLLELTDSGRESFPQPRRAWLDATYDCAAQWDAYQHLAPMKGKRVMQLGGKGTHAVKHLIAGAAEAWVVTPMLGEIRCARALAEVAGVADRVRYAVAVAEELPFPAESFDVVFSSGCVHHMVLEVALSEAARVLRKGGRFAAVEPWRAPLYGIGTKLLGKREPGVYCRPLTSSRLETLPRWFQKAEVVHHGALTRYPLIALDKFGLRSTVSTVWRWNAVDDAICSALGLRGLGSSVAVLGTK